MPLRCIAMVPPALKEWLLINEGGKPFLSRPVATMAALRIWLISPTWRQCSVLVAEEKYVLMMSWVEPRGWLRM